MTTLNRTPSSSAPPVPAHELRPVEVEVGFQRFAEGSALYRCGNTRVLCTVSIENRVPEWMRQPGGGWLTAEYQMHPRANPSRRERRDGRGRPLSGRSTEIQRLIGRSLRAALDFQALGERTITVDCDVLEADGGTRTASITAGFIALCQALFRMQERGEVKPGVLVDQIAAISVGIVGQGNVLDLCYQEDSAAEVDLNLVATQSGAIVEVQGTAEGRAIPRARLDELIDLGSQGIAQLTEIQTRALSSAGIDISTLFAPSKS